MFYTRTDSAVGTNALHRLQVEEVILRIHFAIWSEEYAPPSVYYTARACGQSVSHISCVLSRVGRGEVARLF